MRDLTSNEINIIAGGVCHCYKRVTFGEHGLPQGKRDEDYWDGREGDRGLTTCKERCLSNTENMAWRYSSCLTWGRSAEKDAYGYRGGETIYTGKPLISINFGGG